mmetsp:Transcript_27339/g.78735  ORF Transcript_27339/g.78735 Transcript_27339/m.78735 type:complete len:530 (-) Transcript_27339:105-1694(-)
MAASLGDAPVWLAAATTLASLFLALRLLLRGQGDAERHVSSNAEDADRLEDREQITYEDLVDPKVRRNHLAFNEMLHRSFAGQQFVPVSGEDRCYIAFAYATAKAILNDHSTFSSNPFSDDRLVALNTMSKADHARVLRYVHSHYAQAEVSKLEERIREIIERCTDDLEQSDEVDVVLWAKRIHMAVSLMQLGIELECCSNAGAADGTNGGAARQRPWDWRRVDEVVALNDAMVALVAPLGGVGRRYGELPPGQWARVLCGLLRSLPATLAMAWRLGLRCTWQIIRPDVTVLFPPKQPRMGLWWHPELVQLVPRYFLALYDLLQVDPSRGGPVPGIRAGVEAGDLQLAEALTLMVQLMVNMTSANALANMVFRLATETEAASMTAVDVDRLAPAFVQEVLRLDAPLQRNPRRVARQPGEKWARTPLSKNDQVLVFIGAANLDPAAFPEPTKFRIDREDGDKPALSFGSGMHYCLGSNVVKLEMRCALVCLLKRFSSVELHGESRRLDDVDVGNWGFRRLQVRLHRSGKA